MSADRPAAHDPQAEAQALVGPDLVARVLEPSPPYDDRDPAYLADDPVALDGAHPVVSPVGGGDRSWDDVVADRPELAEWAADRWLTTARPPAPRVPAGYHEGRLALHRLAVYVLSPARMAAIGKMALRHTRGGFGTPFFGPDDRQLRVEGRHLVDQRGRQAHAHPLTTLTAAAEAAGVELDPSQWDDFDVPEPGHPDAPLAVTSAVESFLADWFGFATRVLETVRARVPDADAPSRVQLWPEHFDPAFEAGDESAGRRAGFGASPGDHHGGADPEPYLYVSVWTPDRVPEHAFWNAPFGAKLAFADLIGTADPERAALAFFAEAREHLRA